jgi:conjugative transfer signal peptidase TraF
MMPSLHNWRTCCTLLFVLAGLSMIGGAALRGTAPRFVWNASASAPLGLYILSADKPMRDDFVLVRPPLAVRRLAAERGYLPANVPMVKRIAAADGDRVCAIRNTIIIDRILVAARLTYDDHRRPLPAWSGCRSLGSNEVFLLMARVPDSFDGRYFGVTQRTSIIGKLVPLWAD